MHIEQLSARELEQICRKCGYSKVFIRWCDFLGYSKDDHAIYKCEFTDTFDTTIGNLYVWIEHEHYNVEF